MLKNSNDADMGSIEEKKSDLDGTYENRLGSRSNSFISIGQKSNQNTSGVKSKQVIPSPDKDKLIIMKTYNDGEEVMIERSKYSASV